MRTRARTLLLHCLRHDVLEAAGAGSSTLVSGLLFTTLAGFVVAVPALFIGMGMSHLVQLPPVLLTVVEAQGRQVVIAEALDVAGEGRRVHTAGKEDDGELLSGVCCHRSIIADAPA